MSDAAEKRVTLATPLMEIGGHDPMGEENIAVLDLDESVMARLERFAEIAQGNEVTVVDHATLLREAGFCDVQISSSEELVVEGQVSIKHLPSITVVSRHPVSIKALRRAFDLAGDEDLIVIPDSDDPQGLVVIDGGIEKEQHPADTSQLLAEGFHEGVVPVEQLREHGFGQYTKRLCKVITEA